MSEGVKRYDITRHADDVLVVEFGAQGKWVRASDYDTLSQRNAELEAENERLQYAVNTAMTAANKALDERDQLRRELATAQNDATRLKKVLEYAMCWESQLGRAPGWFDRAWEVLKTPNPTGEGDKP